LFAYPEPPKAVGEDWCCVRDVTAAAWATMLDDLRGLQMEKEGQEVRPHLVRLTACGRRVG
jgi:hypothetical protein